MAEKCPICGEEFADLEEFEEHEAEHHGRQTYGARRDAEVRQRDASPGASPGGNPEIDTTTGGVRDN